jgi:hypothetical protein
MVNWSLLVAFARRKNMHMRKDKLMLSVSVMVILLISCQGETQPDTTATFPMTLAAPIETELETFEPTITLPPANTDAPVIPSAAPPTIEPTSTEVSKRKTLIAIPRQQSNCRSSCSTSQSAISDTLLESVEYFAVGQDSTGNWLQFVGPYSGETCWVINTSINLWWGDLILEQAAVPKDLLPVTSCSNN